MLSLLCSKNPGPPCGVQNPMCPGPCADLSPGPPHGVQRPPHAPGPVWICLVCPMCCTEDPMWPRPCADKSPVPVQKIQSLQIRLLQAGKEKNFSQDSAWSYSPGGYAVWLLGPMMAELPRWG